MTTKITTDVITAGAVTATELASTLNLSGKSVTLATGEISDSELASTLDLSSKTVTLPTGSVSTAMLAGSSVDYTKLAVGVGVQSVITTSGAVASGTTITPFDDTIPQNTEGTALTALDTTITPKATTHRLVIEATVFIASGNTGHTTLSLFQDSTANALACCCHYLETANAIRPFVLRHEMAAGTTSATTFKLRYGNGNAATTTVNGTAAARQLGGTLVSSLRVIEIKA